MTGHTIIHARWEGIVFSVFEHHHWCNPFTPLNETGHPSNGGSLNSCYTACPRVSCEKKLLKLRSCSLTDFWSRIQTPPTATFLEAPQNSYSGNSSVSGWGAWGCQGRKAADEACPCGYQNPQAQPPVPGCAFR